MKLPEWRPTAPVQRLNLYWLANAGVEVAVLRLDLIDQQVSGNKWFKLAPYIEAAARQGAQGLISLGGAHSNHLHALAAAGNRFGFQTVGLLRGNPQLTPTSAELEQLSMELHWLGYGGYRGRNLPGFWQPWRSRYPQLLPVPEGGGGLLGAQGCQLLVEMVRSQLDQLDWPDYHAWWLAVGTGTTLAGLVLAEAGAHPVYGALAVPARHGAQLQISSVLTQAQQADQGYRLLDAARGGFAKVDTLLLDFMQACEAESEMLFEPLYTAKALLALREQVEQGAFPRGTRLIFVHTGGLQGRAAALAKGL
ncbi:1-aminocyclopropane-1-carboxylate deaminase/D-cysteine desulfhydrase [Pseudomonas segetis]|uniref:1-aminocyclopropane-1-carboxylate deaminase n=1 Tax=Pseudomonas segetis TaxID=298908 RepID=A0A238ZX88_9PSED|nr:pyridoxal-phosphate dependent enzyme [Pseudomonas segetis]SNR87879.1 1-aminocyclopropane-1-carboxylate deaminase [Pseudomonas segetis]